MQAFEQAIEQIVAGVPGRVGVSIIWPQANTRLSMQGHLLQPTASLIKLPILCHVMLAARDGTLDLNERVALEDTDRVPGSGVLKEMTTGTQLSLRDLAVLMTIQSDNTATNMLLDRVGIESVNQRMRALGLKRTTLFRRAFRPEENTSPRGARFGFGAATADEIAGLLARIATGTMGSEEVAREVWTILSAQQLLDGIPRRLPKGTAYAGKTGAVDRVRTDAGIVSLADGGVVALAILCDRMPVLPYTADHPALLAMAEIGRLAAGNTRRGCPI